MNESGIHPAGHRILVKPESSFKDIEAGGVIVIPETAKERHSAAQTTGTLVAVGPLAWKHEDFGGGNDWAAIGDRVLFAKYGGLQFKGKDGEQYRLLNDSDLTALVDDEVVME